MASHGETVQRLLVVSGRRLPRDAGTMSGATSCSDTERSFAKPWTVLASARWSTKPPPTGRPPTEERTDRRARRALPIPWMLAVCRAPVSAKTERRGGGAVRPSPIQYIVPAPDVSLGVLALGSVSEGPEEGGTDGVLAICIFFSLVLVSVWRLLGQGPPKPVLPPKVAGTVASLSYSTAPQLNA